MRHGINQPRQHFLGIGGDVAIMDRHDGALGLCQKIPDAGPDVFAFARLWRGEPLFGKTRAQVLHPWAVVPQHPMVLGQGGEISAGVAVLSLIGAVQTDHDVMQIGDAGQFIEDGAQGRAFQFRIKTRQDQRDFAGLGKGCEFILQFLDRTAAQVMELGYIAVLMKVSHGVRLLFGIGPSRRGGGGLRRTSPLGPADRCVKCACQSGNRQGPGHGRCARERRDLR